jgi:hypothetical protein
MSTVNTLADFAERLGQGVQMASQYSELSGGRRPGEKSAAEILRLAATSKSDFER